LVVILGNDVWIGETLHVDVLVQLAHLVVESVTRPSWHLARVNCVGRVWLVHKDLVNHAVTCIPFQRRLLFHFNRIFWSDFLFFILLFFRCVLLIKFLDCSHFCSLESVVGHRLSLLSLHSSRDEFDVHFCGSSYLSDS